MKNSTWLQIRIDPELAESLREFCHQTRTNKSKVVKISLSDYLKANGFLNPTYQPSDERVKK